MFNRFLECFLKKEIKFSGLFLDLEIFIQVFIFLIQSFKDGVASLRASLIGVYLKIIRGIIMSFQDELRFYFLKVQLMSIISLNLISDKMEDFFVYLAGSLQCLCYFLKKNGLGSCLTDLLYNSVA